MITSTVKFFGQLFGETVHQSGKAIDATIELASETADDVMSIPDTFMQGYDEELFESDEQAKKNKEEIDSIPKMTTRQLIVYAKNKNISLNGLKLKKDILKAVQNGTNA